MKESDEAWVLPKDDLTISPDEVHIWRASFEQAGPELDSFAKVLSADETARAAKFHFEHDRRKFIIGRGILRILIGRYLRVVPEQILFSYGSRAKPEINKTFSSLPLQFNLSHSNDLILYAFTISRQVGIDVEFIHPIPELDTISEHYFSKGETQALRQLPTPERLAAFFKYWTCKEAYIKAVGEGFALPLDQFEISFNPSKAAHIMDVSGSKRRLTDWALATIALDPAYLAALVVEGREQEFTVRFFDGSHPGRSGAALPGS